MPKRKEQTVADRVDHVSRSLWRSANSIRRELDRLADVEQYLSAGSDDADIALFAMFRSHLQMIRMECDNLHDGSEPTTEAK